VRAEYSKAQMKHRRNGHGRKSKRSGGRPHLRHGPADRGAGDREAACPGPGPREGLYRDKLELVPVEEREGGLRYLYAAGEFHVFLSTGAPSGGFTQMGFEVEDGTATVEGNYPSKGSGALGTWFRDSEGNLLGLEQPTV
jgi:hypothetical protein